MATNSVTCKSCGNGDTRQMEFLDNDRFVYCKICHAVTPLYTDYVVQEVTGTVTVPGMRSFDEKLVNGYNLLKLGDFDLAYKEFTSLKDEYSTDYRTWFGYGLSVSRNLSVSESKPYDPMLLNRAMQTTGGNPTATGILSEAAAYYEKSNELNTRLTAARLQNDASIRKKAEVQGESTPLLDDKSTREQLLEREKENLTKIHKEGKKNKVAFVIYAILAGAAGYFTSYSFQQYNHYTELGNSGPWALISLVAVLCLGVTGLCAIGGFFSILRQSSKEGKIKKQIRKYSKEISDLERGVSQFDSKKAGDLASLTREIDQNNQSISGIQEEIGKHIREFGPLLLKWCGQMGVRI